MQLLSFLLSALGLTAAMPLAPYSNVQERDPRDVYSHDYVLTLFTNRKNIIEANCNTKLNGFPVSKHICRTNVIKAFLGMTPDSIDKHTCDLDFAINLSGTQAIGADLALYKVAEAVQNNSSYMVYIARKNVNGFPPTPIAYSELSSDSQGWQLFNIDEEAETWTTGESTFAVKVIVLAPNGTVLPCKPLFVTGRQTSNSSTGTPPADPVDYTPVITTFAEILDPKPHLCVSYPIFCEPASQDQDVASSGDGRLRRYTENHDYVQKIFAERQYFKDNNCTVLFNGQPVSPHHCNRNVRLEFFFAPADGETSDSEDISCPVKFDIKLSTGEKVLGADLALYKNVTSSPDGRSDTLYLVLVLQEVTPVFYRLIINEIIDGSVSGWVTFHIDEVAKWMPEERSEFSVRFLVYRIEGDDYFRLLCKDVSSVFTLPPSTDGSALSMASESPEELDYVPVVTAFVQVERSTFPRPESPFRTARSAEFLPRSPTLHRRTSEEFRGKPVERKSCRLEDWTINLSEFFRGNVFPRTINVRQCTTEGLSQRRLEATRKKEAGKEREEPMASSQQEDQQCLPTKSSSLDVLFQTVEGYTMESIPGVVIEQCGYKTL